MATMPQIVDRRLAIMADQQTRNIAELLLQKMITRRVGESLKRVTDEIGNYAKELGLTGEEEVQAKLRLAYMIETGCFDFVEKLKLRSAPKAPR